MPLADVALLFGLAAPYRVQRFGQGDTLAQHVEHGICCRQAGIWPSSCHGVACCCDSWSGLPWIAGGRSTVPWVDPGGGPSCSPCASTRPRWRAHFPHALSLRPPSLHPSAHPCWIRITRPPGRQISRPGQREACRSHFGLFTDHLPARDGAL